MKIFSLLFSIILPIVLVYIGCQKDNDLIQPNAPPDVPLLTSPANGAVNVGESPKFVWSESREATGYNLQVSKDNLFNNTFYDSAGMKRTSKQVNGLEHSTGYYWRVSASNSYGTSGWSEVWYFTTVTTCPGIPTVSYAGKTYNTVQIGSQCWLKENLDVGVRINCNVEQANNGAIEKYCYSNASVNCDIYGGLYQWNEAMQYATIPGSRGICPSGWHIPTMAEFQACSTAVSGNGNALKEIGQGTGGGAGTNASGFSALLAGYRGSQGFFYNRDGFGIIWGSTQDDFGDVLSLNLYFSTSDINIISHYRLLGLSVRCIKD